MKSCGQCPASTCMARSVLGLPPKQTIAEVKSDNSGMIGGIVGGLLGLGIVICAGVYLYIKKGKKKGKLPFAFTDGSVNGTNMMSQDQFHPSSLPLTPHPGVIAALSQHQRESHSQQFYQRDSQQQQPRKFIGLAELASVSSRPTTPGANSFHSLPTTPRTNSFHTALSNNTNEHLTVISPTTPTTVPEEFEEKIALQNKRISHILNNNPRLSQLQPQPLPSYAGNRNSDLSYTTDDDSEYEFEHRPVVVLQRKPTVQAVQVSRAKPQIMRVNSVRSSVNGGLNRSDSVRTILTAVTPSPAFRDSLTGQFPSTPTVRDSLTGQFPATPVTQDDSLTNQFPSTPTNRSFVIEDPFHDDEKAKY
ncbi:hypothetical protein INT48_007034 [Thamnidium elegans]|uniref:Uncharacterized protein n=1 Tax=Thamnidium elegans TaxID=101142 RepID=A0A8H7VQS8_9FUNG|nr:hypothetical protein INT48_007034 [Thamnidium elegans]